MPEKRKMIGETFQNLTVLSETTKYPSSPRKFICRCKCGDESEYLYNYLCGSRAKTPRSCKSCKKKWLAKQPKAKGKDYSNEFEPGEKIGSWVVVRYVGVSKKSNRSVPAFLCRCECGESEREIDVFSLKGLRTMRCKKCVKKNVARMFK